MYGDWWFIVDIGSFIPDAWKYDGTYTEETWPPSAILMTEEEVIEYRYGTPPPGYRLGALNGRPAWVEIVEPVRPLAEVAEEKRVELREACSNEITRSSFQSDALGEVHNYDCRIVDQLNLKVRYDISSATSSDEPLWASDGTRYQWKPHSASEIMEVMIDMNTHIKLAQTKLATKLASVDAATTNSEVQAIAW